MLPPHRAIALPGLHAYTDQISIAAGDHITVHVSSDAPYRVSLYRPGPDADRPEQGAEELAAEHCATPRVQPIHPGSYVHVNQGLPPGPLPALTIECWLFLWGTGNWQAVLSQRDARSAAPQAPEGFGLLVDPEGRLVAATGVEPVGLDEALRSNGPMPLRRWIHVAATFAPGSTALWLDGACIAETARLPAAWAAAAPLRVGASGIDGVADAFLEGDIAMPALYAAALDAHQLAQRVAARGLQAPGGPVLLACWPLDEMRGEVVRDLSPHQRTGRLLNHGTRMLNGPAFDAVAVPRYHQRDAAGHDPAEDVSRRAGLRFASDDLVDCCWDPCHRFTVPASAPSGIYVLRFDYEQDGQPRIYDLSVVVRRAAHRPAARLLVLAATNSWLAYSATPFATNPPGDPLWPRRCAGLPNSHPLAPAQCTYTYHRAGQPTYHAGLRMPRPHTSPRALYAPEGSGFAQWVRLERHLHTWLDRQGYAYDVVADMDLHRDPGLLQGYDAVVVNGHSEYWSAPAYDGLERYLAGGGNSIVLSGNSMYWRVSFDAGCTVMEQRKTHTPHDAASGADSSTVAPAGPHGEQYHSQDGLRGGLWRYADRSCAGAIGLDTAGWGFAEPRDFGVYRVRDAGHFLFHAPFETGLAQGASFGHGPGGALPRAIGHEWDLTTATLVRMTRHWPADAARPDTQAGIHVIAEGIRQVPGRLDAYIDWFEAPVDSLDGLSCEMVYWERPAGGRVFNAGAVGASWVLGVDPQMGRLLANVLAAFAVPYPAQGPYRASAAATEPPAVVSAA